MSILLKQLKIYNQSNPNIYTEINDDENITVKISLDNKGSNMQITLKNAYKEHIIDNNLKYTVGDTVKIYCKYSIDTTDTINTTDDLIMSAEITEIGYSLEEQKSTIILNCTDKTYLLLNKLWAFNYKKSLVLSAPEIIRDLIRINTTEGKSVLGSVNADLVSNGGYIQDTRPQSGSEFDDSFPSPITMAKVYKPVYEWIKDLSQIDMTNSTSELDTDSGTMGCSRPMIFYIDENNKAHWEYPGTTSANYTITTGEDSTYKVHSFKLRRATFDMVNMVIFNAGDDFNGSGVLSYYFDPNADATQLKPTYRPWIDITKTVMSGELVENNDKYTQADDGSLLFHGKNRYNADYTTSWSPSWNDTGSVIDSNSLLNNSLRDYAIATGKTKAQSITSRTASPRFKGSLTMKGYKFNVGTLIDFSSSLHGINNILIRITDVQHTINKNGWFTNLSVEEDPNEYNT